MAHPAISDEINRHVAAVLAISKREILSRLLGEAELCLQQRQVTAAAILAGVALEELSLLSDFSFHQHTRDLDLWRELRNRAAHSASGVQELDSDQVAAMLSAIKSLLQTGTLHRSRTSLRRIEHEPAQIWGKYAFVPTSVDDFLKRKAEDLELENRK